MSFRMAHFLEALYFSAGRRFPRVLGRELVTHGILPSIARLVGTAVITGLAATALLPFPFGFALWPRYVWFWETVASEWLVVGLVALAPVVGLLTLLVNHFIRESSTSSVQERMLRLASCALIVIAAPCADLVVFLLAAAAALGMVVLFAPRAADWLGLIDFDPNHEGR